MTHDETIEAVEVLLARGEIDAAGEILQALYTEPKKRAREILDWALDPTRRAASSSASARRSTASRASTTSVPATSWGRS